jgi:hypothetical protein
MMYEGMSGWGLLWMIIMGVIMVLPFWRICTKIGYPGPLSLLVLVPFLNLGLFYFLAFSQWPIHKTRTPE